MTDIHAAKTALRTQLTAARRARDAAEVADAALAIRDHALAEEAVRRADTVAAYISVGSEPGTGLLVDALRAAGKRVLLPVTLRSMDLDWAPYEGPSSLAPAGFGLLEPTTPRLGVEGIAAADVVLAPALAVSEAGVRIGKGGGCYDRVLARVPSGTPILALLYDDETGRDVPVEPHDRAVTGWLTPSGLTRA